MCQDSSECQQVVGLYFIFIYLFIYSVLDNFLYLFIYIVFIQYVFD